MEDFVTDAGNSRSNYCLVVYSNFHFPPSGVGGDALGLTMRKALSEASEGEQGIAAFPDRQLWSDMCGIQDRGGIAGHKDQRDRIDASKPQHPMTLGPAS